MANAVTSSAALTELQSDLTQLSTTLHEVYDLMNTDMSQVGQAWQDGKYQEFVDGFKPQIQKCELISEQYKLWCTKVLTPQIENVMAVERTDVGSGGGGTVAGASSTAGLAGSGLAASGMAGKASGFNMGGEKAHGQKSSPEVGKAISDFVQRNNKKSTEATNNISPKTGQESSPEVGKAISDFVQRNLKKNEAVSTSRTAKGGMADEHCKKVWGDEFHAERPKPGEQVYDRISYSFTTTGESTKGSVDTEATVGYKGLFGGSVRSKMEHDSGNESQKIEFSSGVNCVPNN